MTNTLERRNDTQSLAAISTETAAGFQSAALRAKKCFGEAISDNSFSALEVAESIEELKRYLDQDSIRVRISGLMNTSLGFRTDKDPKVSRFNRKTGKYESATPYEYEVVKDVVIEALLRGLQLVGNQFNIISGRFYCTKEGFEYLIRKLDYIADFRPVIGIPAQKTGGVVIDCTATWMQNKQQRTYDASIPIKSDEYSSSDQLIGKAQRKFYKRVFEVMTGNSMPDGEIDVATVSAAPAVVPPSVQPAVVNPALVASAAPVATLTEQQISQVRTAAMRQLNAVGVAAFEASICQACGVEDLTQIPAELHTALMQRIADPANRERWDRGCDHQSGEPILTADQLASLLPQEDEVEAVEEPQQQAPAPAVTRKAAPAPVVEAQVQDEADDAQGELV